MESFVLLLQKLLDVRIDVLLIPILAFVVWLICGVPLPPSLLLLFELVLLVLFVLALEADAELPALEALLEAETVFLLAVRFLAGAEDQVLHAGLVSIDLFEVVHVLRVLLLDDGQQRVLFLRNFLGLLVSVECKPSCGLEILVFDGDAARTALPYHAYFPGGEITDAMVFRTLLLAATALMLHLVLRFSV